MAEVSLLFLGDWLECDVAPYLAFASEERQNAVRRFRFVSDKNRSLWAELFARWRLAEASGLSPAEIDISHDEQGKPFCKYLPLSVSLSHSGPYIAVAVGKSNVGVDVERKRKFNLSISRRWFRPKEHEFLTSLPEEERAHAFFRLWTLKEAALKYTGEGLAGGPENVDCFALLEAAEKENADALAGRNFPLPREATVGVVAARRELPDKARMFTIGQDENGIYGNTVFTEQDSIIS